MRFAVLILISLGIISCATTIVPKEPPNSFVSYSGKNLNSGIIDVIPNIGRIVDSGWVTAYNKDVEYYGADPFFSKPLKINDGIVPDGDNFFVDAEHAVDFDIMNTWRSSGTHKPKTLLQKVGL